MGNISTESSYINKWMMLEGFNFEKKIEISYRSIKAMLRIIFIVGAEVQCSDKISNFKIIKIENWNWKVDGQRWWYKYYY